MKFSIKLSIARNISEKQLLLICITSNNQKMATLNRTQHRVSMRADENGGSSRAVAHSLEKLRISFTNKRQTVDSN